MRMPESMSENMSNKCHLVGITRRRVICSEGFQKLTQDSQNDALCGPARIIAIINNDSDIKHLLLDSCVSFSLCALAVVTRFAPIRFYKRRLTHRSLYTEQLFRADIQIFLLREVCAQKNFCIQFAPRFLRKEGRIYTQMLCTKMLCLRA